MNGQQHALVRSKDAERTRPARIKAGTLTEVRWSIDPEIRTPTVCHE